MTITRLEPGTRMSEAVTHGDTVYLAGQVATRRDGSIAEQTKDVLETIDRLLAAAGTSKSKVLSVQVLLASIGDFAAMNAVYDAWIDPANPPARACYEARLADPAVKVEILTIAALD